MNTVRLGITTVAIRAAEIARLPAPGVHISYRRAYAHGFRTLSEWAAHEARADEQDQRRADALANRVMTCIMAVLALSLYAAWRIGP